MAQVCMGDCAESGTHDFRICVPCRYETMEALLCDSSAENTHKAEARPIKKQTEVEDEGMPKAQQGGEFAK